MRVDGPRSAQAIPQASAVSVEAVHFADDTLVVDWLADLSTSGDWEVKISVSDGDDAGDARVETRSGTAQVSRQIRGRASFALFPSARTTLEVTAELDGDATLSESSITDSHEVVVAPGGDAAGSDTVALPIVGEVPRSWALAGGALVVLGVMALSGDGGDDDAETVEIDADIGIGPGRRASGPRIHTPPRRRRSRFVDVQQ